jgi:predicted metal-dependent phosphoesterase TrpH
MMMKELLFDMHVHTSGISRCSRVPAPELVRRCKLTGLDGIVLTNHFAVNHVDGDPFKWRKKYEEEFYITRKEGEKAGLAVLFGIEVTPLTEGGRDFLIYGVDPDFLYQEKMLYEYNQAQLCRIARDAGAVFVNAHPFRNGKTPKEPEYLDGVEVNCHPLYHYSHMDEMAEIAAKNNLILTCGGDYHADTHRVQCGMYLPESVTDGVLLGEYLKSTTTVELCIQEVGQTEAFRATYCRV